MPSLFFQIGYPFLCLWILMFYSDNRRTLQAEIPYKNEEVHDLLQVHLEAGLFLLLNDRAVKDIRQIFSF